MSLIDKVGALATRVGSECKTLHDQVGDITALTTTAKNSTVVAINELNTAVGAINTSISGLIDDSAASTTKVYSSSKVESVVSSAVSTAKNELLNGAGDAYDTLKELGDLIDTNKGAIEALQEVAAGHVKYDAAQTLTEAQQTQARANIAAAAAADLTTLSNNVGDTDTNFVTLFEAALTAAA